MTWHSNHPGHTLELLTRTDLSSFIELVKTNGYKDQLWFMNLAHRKKERKTHLFKSVSSTIAESKQQTIKQIGA